MSTVLNIKVYPLTLIQTGTQYAVITWQSADYYFQQVSQIAVVIDTVQDLTTTPYATFTDVDTAIAYYNVVKSQEVVDDVNTSIGLTYFTSYDTQAVDPAVSADFMALATIAFTGEYADLLGEPLLATVATSGKSSDLTNDAGFITSGALASYATTAYVDGKITSVIGAAPGALDTLKELADAINDDASYAATITTSLTSKVDKVTGFGLSSNDYTSTEKTKLAGLAAQVNSDWNAISGLAQISNKPSLLTKAYEGVTLRSNAFPIFKSATVASGVAVFYLTNDNTSTGTALFPNGIIADSINVTVNDATASYQMSWALTNSNKTLTVTANKLTTANILTGLLGQTAANATVVKLSVFGY